MGSPIAVQMFLYLNLTEDSSNSNRADHERGDKLNGFTKNQ